MQRNGLHHESTANNTKGREGIVCKLTANKFGKRMRVMIRSVTSTVTVIHMSRNVEKRKTKKIVASA